MKLKCPFCNKQPSYYSKKAKLITYLSYDILIAPFFRCRHCNVVCWLHSRGRSTSKEIQDICLFYNPFYIRLNYYRNVTELWKFNKKKIYSNKNMLIATRYADHVTTINSIISVSPDTLNQKIKTILTFS